MDHSFIDREQIIDRYLLGTLSDDLVEEFEEHYFGCSTCLDQLEAARQMQQAVKRLAADEAAEATTITLQRARPARSRRAPRLALVAALLLMVLGPAALLWQFGTPPPQIESNPLLLELSPTRTSAQDPPTARLRQPAATRTVVLTLLLDRAEFPLYAGTLRDPEGASIWRGEDLVPNPLTALSLALPSTLLSAGDYTVEIEGLPATGDPVPVTRYRFRIEGRGTS